MLTRLRRRHVSLVLLIACALRPESLDAQEREMDTPRKATVS